MFDADDYTLAEFLELLETYELRHVEHGRELLGFHHHVLEAADKARAGSGYLSWLDLRRLAQLPPAVGVTGGPFWAIVEWLGEHGLPVADAGEEPVGIYLHPVGMSFLAGYRAFGTNPDRWEELIMEFVEEGLG